MSRRGQDRLGESLPAPLRGLGGLLALVAVAAGVAYAVLSLSGLLADDDRSSEEIFAGAVEGGAAEDPFAWEPDRRKDLERGAALGFSHVIYELSPGGVIASARRTARFRDAIERAAEAGADVFVAGSAVFNADNPADTVSHLRATAEAAVVRD